MIQLYPLRVAYLLFASLMLFLEVFRYELSAFLRLKLAIRRKARLRLVLFWIGLSFSLLTLFFPVSPGPTIIGDFLPSVALVYAAFYFKLTISEEKIEVVGNNLMESRSFRSALFLGASAVLDLLFPNLILL